MDRWIRHAWRAFWVGLGASAVLIGQSVLAPEKPAQTPASIEEIVPMPTPKARSADPILSRNPFDSKTGPLKKSPQT